MRPDDLSAAILEMAFNHLPNPMMSENHVFPSSHAIWQFLKRKIRVQPPEQHVFQSAQKEQILPDACHYYDTTTLLCNILSHLSAS